MLRLAGIRGEAEHLTAVGLFLGIGIRQIGDLLMATPALSDGVMFVRSARRLLAIGEPRR